MSDLGHHLMLRLEDDRVIAPTVEAKRRTARTVLEIGRSFRLLTFCAVDTHLHAESACDGAAAGEMARRLKLTLVRRLRLNVKFTRSRLVPIRDQHHLERTFFYILRQHQHHGYGDDPFHDGSNLPDLLGLRLCGAYTAANVRSLLPRVRRGKLLAAFGLENLNRPASVPPQHIAEAAAAAACLPAVTGRSKEVVQARVAAVHLAGRTYPARELARALGCSAKTVRRLRTEEPDEALVRAVELQVRLRACLSEPEDRLSAAIASDAPARAAAPITREDLHVSMSYGRQRPRKRP